jgi:RNA polymerase sigma factor (sigma-70 family)
LTDAVDVERLLRESAPQALGALARRTGDFAGAEDAMQEALLAAVSAWPEDGVPDNPVAWLVRVASRRLVEQYRRDTARRRREEIVEAGGERAPDPASAADDSLVLLFMCCHPALTPASAIPLTLRAVGGLTTREIAAAFLVPESTMAQRISRAKARVAASAEPFAMPAPADLPARLRSVLSVLYLVFTEGSTSTTGPAVARSDLTAEAIRLTRGVHAARPDDPEVAGLLALMLLTDARRPARVGPAGELVPLAEQDRTRWDRRTIGEGLALVTAAIRQGNMGEYQVQAAIAGVHDQARRYEDTNWGQVAALYARLERLTGSPVVRLNRAVALAMVDGPAAGLALLDGLEADLGDHHRLHAVRGDLLERAGDADAALVELRAAAAGATNQRERDHLTTRAARLASARARRSGGGCRDAASGSDVPVDAPPGAPALDQEGRP